MASALQGRAAPVAMLAARCPCAARQRRRAAPARRACTVVAASASAAVIRGDAAGEALVAWARSDGAFVSPSLAVNAVAGGVRGVVACAPVATGDVLIWLPPSCTCFSAAAARDEGVLGVGAAVRAYDAAHADAPLSDEAALALWCAAAADAPPEATSPLSPYAAALPAEAPDLPALWPAAHVEALLPWWMADAAAADAADAADAVEAAAEAARGMPAGRAPSAARLEWAWAHVRARAIKFQVRSGKDGSLSWSKCLMPVVDSQNHEPDALGDAGCEHAGADWGWLAAPLARGPASRVEFEGGGARWVATRDIAPGEHVTWRRVPCTAHCMFSAATQPHMHTGADCPCDAATATGR
jgi:hypothetical protein